MKAGQGHFRNLKEKLPDVFQELMEQEHHLKNYVSAYHYIRKECDFDEDVKEVYLRDLDNCYEDYFNGKAKKPKVFVAPNLHMKKFSFMKKSINGEVQPYQIRDLHYDVEEEGQQIDLFDIGGCGCFFEFDEEGGEACEIQRQES